MIQTIVVVNSYGGLIGTATNPAFQPARETCINKIMCLASTVYTGLEILESEGICSIEGPYSTLFLECVHGNMSVFRTATKLIFIVVHSTDDPSEAVLQCVVRAHSHYVQDALYNPLYKVDGRLPDHIFKGIF